jgi:hypothetical protein
MGGVAVAAILAGEAAVRELAFREPAPVRLAGSRRLPPGVALTATVKPDIFWLGRSFEIVAANNSDKDLRTVVLEADGSRCLLRAVSGEADLPKGGRLRLYHGLFLSNTREFKPAPVRSLPRRFVLYCNEGTFEWTLGDP